MVEDLKFKLLDKVIWGERGGAGSEVARSHEVEDIYKMVEEEEMEKQEQVNDSAFDECTYVKDDDDLCA